MEKPKRQTSKPEGYNGVTVGAVMVLIGLTWFTLPYVFANKQFLVYPWIMVGVGLITFLRHALKTRR